MNRAERRRQQKKETKKPAVYNMTYESLAQQTKIEVEREFAQRLKEERIKATQDAVDAAVILLFTLPCEVLIEKYWKKSAAKKIPKFMDDLLDCYSRYQNGELDMGKMKKDLWEIGGLRLEGEVKGYKNQAVIDEINKQVAEVHPCLGIDRVTAGDDMVAISVGLDVPERGNKEILKKLRALGFRRVRKQKMVDRALKDESKAGNYFIVLEKDIEVAEYE